jgi:SAM-dependent methyltransferase
MIIGLLYSVRERRSVLMIRCANCSHENPEGTRYCQRCGINLGDAMRPPYLSRPAKRPGMLSGWRYDLLANVQGRVLEMGVRDGPNFPFYPPDVKVVATDVDIDSIQGAKNLFPRFRQGIALSLADAQQLPFAASSFDAVVTTLVFCSIPNPQRALSEVARVLKPGGHFFTIDHVRCDQPIIGALQDLFASPWKVMTGGCNLNRQTEDIFRSAGYTIKQRREALAGIMRWIVAEPPRK